MQESLIKNFNELATTTNRRRALQIAEAGLSAINTQKAVNSSVSLIDNILFVKGKGFNLAKFKRIKVIGFGKASAEGATALEKILGPRIQSGAIVGLDKVNLNFIESFLGTHPKPSKINVEAGKKIYELIKDSTTEDLIIVLVSGGGSAMLCYGDDECEQGIKLYDSFLKSGKTITEINTVRKHLSLFKGGGLAKIAYPATIIGLVFSDIPGNNFENVASGPTYKDITTIVDAEKIIKENNLGEYNLIETPKDDKYFDNVYNFVVVSNETAIEAMAQKGKELNLKTKIVSTELYDESSIALEKIFSAVEDNALILGAGEPRIEVLDKEGKGGRNLHMGLVALKNHKIKNDYVFISMASDGMDNGDSAGAIVDMDTYKKVDALGLDINDYSVRFDSYSLFQKTGDIILTGPTGANVSDLMILLTKK